MNDELQGKLCQGRSKLDMYVDGEGSNEERAGVESHLRSCGACATDALGRLQLKNAIQAAAARYTPSPEFRERMQRSMRQRDAPANRNPRLKWEWMPGLAAPIALAALLLIVASAALWTRHFTRLQYLAELVDLHVATLASANPVDVISTDRHTVKPWFQGKLPFTFNLPELQDSSFKLLGGRVTYFRHSPGAQLLYEVRSHKMSVFVFQEQPGQALPWIGSASRELAFNAETWNAGGLRYVVVGDTSRADIHALAELLQAAGQS